MGLLDGMKEGIAEMKEGIAAMDSGRVRKAREAWDDGFLAFQFDAVSLAGEGVDASHDVSKILAMGWDLAGFEVIWSTLGINHAHAYYLFTRDRGTVPSQPVEVEPEPEPEPPKFSGDDLVAGF